MDVMDAIAKRYSCRAYEDRAVPEALLDELIEAARLAPSARNFQDWRFVVVTDPAVKNQLCDQAIAQPFVRQAPALIVACGCNPYVMRCGQPIRADRRGNRDRTHRADRCFARTGDMLDWIV